MTALEMLRVGRTRLASDWRQYAGDADDEAATGRFCALEALPVGAQTSAALVFLYDAAHVDDGPALAAWQDEPGRKLAEVIAVYDRAIALAGGV